MKTLFVPSVVLCLSVLLVCCKLDHKKAEPAWNELPNVTSLDSLQQTAFSPTLEGAIDSNKNIVYAPALLYAWDKLEKELKSAVIIDSSNSLDFRLLAQSGSYQGVLQDSEYSTSIEIVGSEIIATAFFNKTLPFQAKLQKAAQPIVFGNTKVAAFGMYHYDEEAVKFTEVLYYNNDSDFILKLSPKDKQHEIVLAKGIGNYSSLQEGLGLANEKISKGKAEKASSQQLWKYGINHEDVFSIPTIQFNIGAHYRKIEGQLFSTRDQRSYTITEAYQRTGFILNENGAVVESEAVVAADSAKAIMDNPRPKKMVFDQEFLIIIKRVDAANPYFVMKVNNAELLKKE